MKKNSKKVYKKVHRLPTKKQEADFVANLKLSEKQYIVVELKKPDELYNNGDWEAVAYNKKRKLLNRLFTWLADICR